MLFDGGIGGLLDRPERFTELLRVTRADPEVAVADVLCLAGDVQVEIGEGVLLSDEVEHLGTLGHAADDIFVANLGEFRVALGGNAEV